MTALIYEPDAFPLHPERGETDPAMKRKFDLEKAADAEAFGALAVSHRRMHRRSGAAQFDGCGWSVMGKSLDKRVKSPSNE